MDLEEFAERWIDDWNSHDLDRVLSHYANDAEFRSPIAAQRVGDGIVKGRDALQTYWSPAFEKRPNLRFHLKKAFVGHRAISIHYGDELGRDIIETLLFDETGKAIFGCGCYSEL